MEIGSNSTVDRGSVDDTVIGRGSKLDNLVHVGHNVRIGARCLLMAGVGIAGSTRVGDGAILAGHVGVTDHLTIGAGARVAAKSGVFGDVAGQRDRRLSGSPHRQFLRAQAALFRLAPIISDVERLVADEERRAMARRTLAREAVVRGIGLHSGREALARCIPRRAGAGHRVSPGGPARRASDSRAALQRALHRPPHRAGRGRRIRRDGRAPAGGRGGAPDRRPDDRARRAGAADRRRVLRALRGGDAGGGDGGAAGRPGGLPRARAVPPDGGRCLLCRVARPGVPSHHDDRVEAPADRTPGRQLRHHSGRIRPGAGAGPNLRLPA